MESQFRIRTRTFARGVILDMDGDVTKQAEDALLGEQSWGRGLDVPGSYLILNFSNVSYMNSSGIAVLIRLVRTGAKGRFHTFAYGISPHFQKLFRMVGLTEYMMIYPDEYAVLERIDGLTRSQ